MNCNKCNQPIPTDTPYRTSSVVDESVPVKSDPSPLTRKTRLALWTFCSGLGRTLLGLGLFAIVLGVLWCLFPGLTRLGFFVHDHISDLPPGLDIRTTPSGERFAVDGWIIGFLTSFVGAIGCACIWFARRIGDWIIARISRKGNHNGNAG